MNERSDALVPMPDTHHPYYSDDEAAAIRSAIVNGLHTIQWLDTQSMPDAAFADPAPPLTSTLPVTTLTVKKCAGPAPFVGDPYLNDARYYWRVAVDDLGRHVAGEAELTWRYAPPPLPRHPLDRSLPLI